MSEPKTTKRFVLNDKGVAMAVEDVPQTTECKRCKGRGEVLGIECDNCAGVGTWADEPKKSKLTRLI